MKPASRTVRSLCSPSHRSHRFRRLHTASVTDGDITRLAARPLHPLTLADLVKYGRPPLSAQALFRSANFTLSILPARLAHRIQSLRNLPFIVVANPHITTIHRNYVHSLSTLLPWAEKEIATLDDEIEFTQIMTDLVHTHANTISILARGFLEARRYVSPRDVTSFLDEHLRARIGTRLVAEQHLALHFSSQPHRHLARRADGAHSESDVAHAPPSFIGVIDTQLRPARIVQHCESIVAELCELKYGVRPHVVINGEPEYAFAHVPVHLEYIITELLKNAFRATVERGHERDPIEVTIAPLPEPDPEGLAPPPSDSSSRSGDDSPRATVSNADQGNVDAASHVFTKQDVAAAQSSPETIRPLAQSTPGVTLRIRDRGGGIAPENFAHIWDYSFTTFNENQVSSTLDGASGSSSSLGSSTYGSALNVLSSSGVGGGASLAGLGYGLPLGRAYAEYFGGAIAVQSLSGWGTDVYLSLRGVGKMPDMED